MEELDVRQEPVSHVSVHYRGTRPGFLGRRIALGVTVLLLAALALAACGRSDSGPAAEPRVIPTMPSARFAQPTTMISSGSTAAAGAETAEDGDAGDAGDADDGENGADAVAAETPTPAAPVVDLARGANVYQVRGCGDCHGAQAEGIPGEGSALAGLSMSESQFTSILRTGGSGRLGSGHLYGPSAISPGGMTALHAWLQSLDED